MSYREKEELSEDLIVKTARGRSEIWHPAIEFKGPGVVIHTTAGAIGHPHGSEFVVPDPGTHIVIETVSPAPTPPPTSFLAYCGLQHEAGTDGVNEDGSWTSVTRDRCVDSRAEVDSHQDGGAIVTQFLGGAWAGPVGCV